MLSETDRQFFKPFWRRVVATLTCAVWASIEWLYDEPMWASFAVLLTLYCLWNFFYRFEDDINEDDSAQ
ncbi:hypothetical protein [Marinomonas posidonica]|uniref:DUF3329 domain-containing protein n=1 Tax=Marinomonas posidonica (strain CECT 7376 / NCIMB 14433 / IVIA-Po-181) TaxID=491952 RepID=F6CSP2_MARPP|nr:hypothetical protein [Marinomonas posidonica]AEF56200.1 hypothetical protein Mar181_3177 [Marinomonas posidonica IVIA-Po-181]